MRRATSSLLLCLVAVLVATALPAEASAVGEPIARFTCSAPGLVCQPCAVSCSSPTGSVTPGTPVTFDGRPSSEDRVGAFPGTVVG
ncbi:MAG: hypothetical protein WKF48_02190 [Solirubrobacteraceae bacterium]